MQFGAAAHTSIWLELKHSRMNEMNQFVFWMCPIRTSVAELPAKMVDYSVADVQTTQHTEKNYLNRPSTARNFNTIVIHCPDLLYAEQKVSDTFRRFIEGGWRACVGLLTNANTA